MVGESNLSSFLQFLSLHYNSPTQFILFFFTITTGYYHITSIYIHIQILQLLIKYIKAQTRRATAARGGGGAGGGRAAGGTSNILQFYTDDSPGLQVGPTTVLVASLSFVGVVVLLHIWGKFRM